MGTAIITGSPRRRAAGILLSSPSLGLLVGLAAWGVNVLSPVGGLDPSWQAGLFMAAHQGLRFGSQVVFTYGPLGFLAVPGLWYDGLGVLAFVYSGLLYLALSISLLIALRRALHPVLAIVGAYLLLVAAPSIEVPVALAAIWCLILLAPEPPRFAGPLVRYGGGVLGGVESLVLLRSGPLILLICASTLLAGERRVRSLLSFVAVAVIAFFMSWFAAGQTLGNLPSYVSNGSQIILGYSQAMGLGHLSSLKIAACALLVIGLVALAVYASRPGQARWAAGLALGIAGFALFKEAIVRQDDGQLDVFFSTVAAIGAGIAFADRRTLSALLLAGLVGVAVAMPRAPNSPAVQYSPITHLDSLQREVNEVVSPARERFLGAVGMAIGYRLDPPTLALLQGHRVHIDPWEAGVAWLNHLNWDPLPVFQDYSAYTSDLDQLNARALAAPTGPDRVLRENLRRDDPLSPSADIDGRFEAWDPPAQALALLCHFQALRTTARWEVVGRVGNRCGQARLLDVQRVTEDHTISLPSAPRGEVLYARIGGIGVSGTERVLSLLFRAHNRHALVNGTQQYRLIPGTAGDGLLMNSSPGTDYPGPFALSPQARTLRLRGVDGPFTVRLYAMPVRAS